MKRFAILSVFFLWGGYAASQTVVSVDAKQIINEGYIGNGAQWDPYQLDYGKGRLDISEADCMADWLIAHGVDESRIYREDRSTSTQENFAYSEEIMAELGLDAGDMFAFVTNDYHIFRAGRIAGTDAACGVAATLPRSAYYDALQLNYYVREAFATGWLLLRGK